MSVTMRNLIVAACVVLGAEGVLAAPYEIGEAMAEEAFWKSDPVLFVSKHQEDGFKFTSEGREAADSRREGGVAYYGIPVYEARVAFGEQGGVERVELTLFNRGGTEDVEEMQFADGKKMQRLKRVEKEMTKEDFFKVVDDVRGHLTKKGKKPSKPELQRMKDTDIRQYEQIWPKSDLPSIATLTWNYEQGAKKTAAFHPGFIRLAVDGPAVVEKSGATKQAAKAKKSGGTKLADNVVRESRGDVFVDNVPMVDQGQKGYCAAAASERVLRYYGLDVDEHEIAVAASTDADGGTSTAGMIKSVTAIGKRNKLATAVLYGDADKGAEERIANLEKEVNQYNKAAKKLKKPQIAEDVYIQRSGNMISYSPSAVDAAMDPEVRKEVKVNGVEKPKYMRFMKNVRQYVNEGKPLLWGVTLGTYPEADLPQARGGHMRLIIGYNDKKGEILYSDSWGKGHELKRMPSDWAWTITDCLLGLRPLK